MSVPVPPDLAAMLDVIDNELVPAIDDLDGPRADAFLRGAEALAGRAKTLVDGVKAKLMSLAEAAPLTTPSGRVYIRRDKTAKRADHAEVGRQVVQLAVHPDADGVIPDAHTAARNAVRLMRQIYLTESTPAPKSKLEEVGITGKITNYKITGSELEIVETRVREEED